MVNEKIVQVHTHKIMPGAECAEEKPCSPMYYALEQEWLTTADKMPFGATGEEIRAVMIGDWSVGYLSVFRFCPFCGVQLEKFARYAQFHAGPPVMNEWKS